MANKNYGAYRPGGNSNQNNSVGYRQNANQNNNRNNNNGGNNNNGEQKKYNNCQMKSSYVRKSDGEQINSPCVWGYIRKYGQSMSYVAVASKNFKTSNEDIRRMTVKVKEGVFGAERLENGFWNKKKQILTIPDLRLICNPILGYTILSTRPRR